MAWAIWITGPPGSGKTTLTRAVVAALESRGIGVEVLGLDEIRQVLTPEPTYSELEHEVVHRALAYLAKRLTEAGRAVIVDATAPRRAWRELARTLIPVFAEVQLRCPIEVCRGREAARRLPHAPPGIHTKSGQPAPTLPRVEGPYEEAVEPELVIDMVASDLGTAVQEVIYLTRRLQRLAAWLETRSRLQPLLV